MHQTLKILIFALLCQINISYAIDFQYKTIKDFDTLSSFKSPKEFETNYKKYIQNCLDNTGGGTGGISCFIGYEMWDRELNIYYKKLYALLNKNERKLLKQSQKDWLKERDSSIKFNSLLLDNIYTGSGTMYASMRAGDADATATPIVKQRALLLKMWYDQKKQEN